MHEDSSFPWLKETEQRLGTIMMPNEPQEESIPSLAADGLVCHGGCGAPAAPAGDRS